MAGSLLSLLICVEPASPGAVGHVDLGNKVWPHMYAKTLREEKGYITGLFGKCMNGTHSLTIQRWLGL